ncbi:DUF5953 family protein [Myxococcus faecalis]|uniref:DUF5953 family protein n=1 Tax=Myxococcus faecalis TaxID=3115646 RepID=UPI003CF3E286
MTQQKTLIITVYAPALAGNDGRPLSVIHGMEKALSGLRLEWRLSTGGRPVALPQRDEWLSKNTVDGGFPLMCNGDIGFPVTVSGSERDGLFSPGGHAQFQVHAELPLEEPVIAAATAIFESMAEGARAFWGRAAPDDAAADIAHQTAPTLQGPPSPLRGLPALKLFEDIRSPEIPYYLGWLNYWSEPAAKAIGFPDPARDADLLSRSQRTASGGWVVQLTDAPLDLDNPAHLDALKQTYERFPEIGGRSDLR